MHFQCFLKTTQQRKSFLVDKATKNIILTTFISLNSH